MSESKQFELFNELDVGSRIKNLATGKVYTVTIYHDVLCVTSGEGDNVSETYIPVSVVKRFWHFEVL